ncbi:MAG TPA: hydroxysqualene dehydroxylase HpnE [Pseudolabrys sp.]|jgi:squalene-associated FAD-dependent desaturase|nr:hydroxysqualene dehydroxylase HpnE [Pseudolabrys sp.]
MRSSDIGRVHIIGAGLAGLAAGVRLADAGRAVTIHEATKQAGGRCRSYFDQGTGMLIDNGTHLLLSGNHAVLSYADAIGSRAGLSGPKEAEFSFIDIATGEQWTLRFGESRFPWWVFDKDRRVPQTAVSDYLPLARLAWTSADKSIGEVMNCSGPLYDRLLEPLFLAALNINPREGSTKLASALIRETLALGGQACRPLLARDGLGSVFVEPAISHLQERGASIVFEDELVALPVSEGRVSALNFAKHSVELGSDDAVILAVPPNVATSLMPGLSAPTEFRGIVNAHFRIDPPAPVPPMLGIINGTSQWIFAFPGKISATISDAGQLFDMPRAELAAAIWRDIAKIANLPVDDIPPWQIVRERRATFAATPGQNALRPAAETSSANLFLAGDWTATGLPATLESAVRSGYRAADLVNFRLRAAA